MIRTPRDNYGQARATLNFITAMKGRRVVLDVFAVHGCTRTARMAAMRVIKHTYRPRLQEAASGKVRDHLCLEMDNILKILQKVE